MTESAAELAAQDEADQVTNEPAAAACEDPAATVPPLLVGTGMPDTTLLELFGQWIYIAFGKNPYHVGSSLRGKAWRDVDVRLMLPDEDFHALFPGYQYGHQRDAKWALICAAISELGKRVTGLPIDFQIQPTTEANARYGGRGNYRNPLDLFTHARAEAENRRRAEREAQVDGDAPSTAG